MRSILVFTALLLFCVTVAVWGTADKAAQSPKGEIVGSAKCNVCHKSKKRGNQAAVWQESKHAKAFEVLASDEAKAVAAKKGLGDPQKEPECLACHTTQHFWGEAVKIAANTKYTIEEGVGCEICHGPGSLYQKTKVMKDPEAARTNGLIDPNEEFCLKCHNQKSPSFREFNFKERWAQIAHPRPKN